MRLPASGISDAVGPERGGMDGRAGCYTPSQGPAQNGHALWLRIRRLTGTPKSLVDRARAERATIPSLYQGHVIPAGVEDRQKGPVDQSGFGLVWLGGTAIGRR